MRLRVRDAVAADVAVIADFQIRMARETEDLTLDPVTVARGVAAVLHEPVKGRYWIAEADGQVVGALLTTPEWSDWRNGYVLWLQSVYVAPERRMQGIFRALYQKVRRHVEISPDILGIRLYVDRRNERARAVYQAMGMTGDHYATYEWMKQA